MVGNKSPISWGSRLVALILLLLVGYAAYQIMVCHTITNDIAKSRDSAYFYLSKRAVFVAATFAIILAAGCLLSIKVLRNELLVLLVPAVMVVCAGQAGALLGFMMQTAAGLAIGIPLFRRLRGGRMPTEISLSGLILSWFLGGSVNAYFVWIALHWKINYSSLYYGVALVEIGVFWHPLANAFAFICQRIKSGRFTPGQWAVALWAIFILPHALVPTYMFDECLRHVFFPKQVALFAQHVFDPGNVWAVDTEVFAQSHYTIGYLLGGEYVLRFSNLASIVAGMLLLENFSHRTFGLRTAFFTALTLISTPLLGIFIACIYLEPFNFLSIAAIITVTMDGIQRLDRNTVVFSFVLSAVAFLYKQQAVFFAVPLALFFAVLLSARCIRQRSYRPIVWLASGALAAILIVAPFFAQNYYLTKNPFYPWLNGIFRSELMPPVNWEGCRFNQAFGFSTLSDLTFHGERFWESHPFPFGVNFFVLTWFIPFVLIRGKKKALICCILGLFSASIFLWWVITSPNMRYFVGPLTAGSILLGLTMNMIWRRISRDRVASSLGCAALTIAMGINALSLLNTTEALCPYPLIEVFTRQYYDIGPGLPNFEEIRKVFLIAYAKFGKKASCLLASPPFICLADQHIEMPYWTYRRNYMAMEKWQNEEEAFDWIFRKRKFACVIMHQSCNIPLLDSPRFREMVNVEFEHVGFLLLTPKTDAQIMQGRSEAKRDALDFKR